MRTIKKGSTDQSVVIRIVDETTGQPENAVEHNTSGIDLWYRREGAAKTSITEAALSALTDAHSDGGIELIGDGYYRLDLPDAAFATGANGVMVGGTVSGMVVIGCYIHLVDYDPQDATDLGLSDIGSILTDTAEIGAAGAGLTAIPWNASWDAEVQSEVADGLTAFWTSPATLVDLVWDEVITGAQHNVAASAARFLREASEAVGTTGTAQAGAAGTITLAASASATSDIYNGERIQIIEGTGAGQSRLITDYDGATRVATVDRNWTTNPSSDSLYSIQGADADVRAIEGSDTAADNLLSAFNGGSYNVGGGSIVAASVTGNVGGIAGTINTLDALDTAQDTQHSTTQGIITTVDTVVDSILVDTTQIKADLPSRPTKAVELANFMFLMVDETDLNTPETGVTVTATISKDGGAFAACTNSVSEVSGGWFKITLTSTEMNADSIALKFTATGCAQRNIAIRTQP